MVPRGGQATIAGFEEKDEGIGHDVIFGGQCKMDLPWRGLDGKCIQGVLWDGTDSQYIHSSDMDLRAIFLYL